MSQNAAGMERWSQVGISIQMPDFRNLHGIPT